MIDVDRSPESDLDSEQSAVRSKERDFAVGLDAENSRYEHVLESFKERYDHHVAEEMRRKVVDQQTEAGEIRPNGTD